GARAPPRCRADRAVPGDEDGDEIPRHPAADPVFQFRAARRHVHHHDDVDRPDLRVDLGPVRPDQQHHRSGAIHRVAHRGNRQRGGTDRDRAAVLPAAFRDARGGRVGWAKRRAAPRVHALVLRPHLRYTSLRQHKLLPPGQPLAMEDPMPTARSALVLQGGGALGAYELGAARALYASGKFAPDAVAGVSIGAISAVLLARPGGGRTPLEALEAFWEKVTVRAVLFPPPLRPYASFLGNRHFFVPR